jgi:hypothetical protein
MVLFICISAPYLQKRSMKTQKKFGCGLGDETLLEIMKLVILLENVRISEISLPFLAFLKISNLNNS